MSRVRRSLAISLVSRYTGLGLQFVNVVVLSRLLTPQEIGVFSVAASLAALLTVLRMFGVPDYIVAEKELTREKLRAGFTVAVAISFALGLGLILLRHPAAAFYDDVGIARVIEVSALSFFIMPLGIVSFARMHRDLEFGRIAVVNLTSAVVSLGVTVGLAFGGFSYMSMAWGNLAGNAAMALAILLFTRRDFLFVPTAAGLAPVFRFGVYSSLTGIVGTVGEVAPDLIIGRLLSFEAVGMFGRAAGLVRLFREGILGAIAPVARSWFAHGNRVAPHLLKADFLKATAMLSGLSWPFYVLMGLAAPEVTLVLYGDQWLPAVPATRILCVAAMLGTASLNLHPLIKGLGRMRLLFWLSMVQLVPSLLAIAIGSHFGIVEVASGLVAAAFIRSIVAQRVLRLLMGIAFVEFAASQWRSAAATAIMTVPAGAVLLVARHEEASPFVIVASLAVVAPLALIAGYRISGHELWRETKRLALNLHDRLRAMR